MREKYVLSRTNIESGGGDADKDPLLHVLTTNKLAIFYGPKSAALWALDSFAQLDDLCLLSFLHLPTQISKKKT